MTKIPYFAMTPEIKEWLDSSPPPRPLDLRTVLRCTDDLKQAAKHVKINPERPCAYTPWLVAFTRVNAVRDTISRITWGVEAADWSQDLSAFKEFTFTFLEADPMYHGSGYCKRHLIKRLGQNPLDQQDIDRLDFLFRRAVTQGTGLEEYRAYCKLAAKIRPAGLEKWLRETSSHAILNGSELNARETARLRTSLSESEFQIYLRQGFRWPPRVGFHAEGFGLVKNLKKSDWEDPELQVARNAWRMLRAIERRRESEPLLQVPIR